jgi:hypothetical protein
MQKKIRYKDVMDMGFSEEVDHDQVFIDEHGFDYTRITLDLTKKIYMSWEKETQLAQMIRLDGRKECNILNRLPIRDLDHLKELVEFFTTKNPKGITEDSYCVNGA